MSLVDDGKRILCDGEGCCALAAVAVALRRTLKLADETPSAGDGWLYVLKKNSLVHYCPRCASRYLACHCDDKRG